MKRLCITYHMHKNHGTVCDQVIETAESCITLPMTDDIADDILANGSDSKYLSSWSIGSIYQILARLAELQGYYYDGRDGFCTAEEREF